MKTKKHNCYVLFTDDSEMHREDVCNYKGRIKIFHNDKMNLVTEGKKYKLLLRGYSPKTELDGRRVWVEGFLKHGKLYATVVFLKGDKETDKIVKKHNTKRDNQSAEEIFLKKCKSVEETKDVEEIRKEVNPFLSLMNMEDLYEDSKEEKSPFSESRKSGVFEMSVKHVKRILGSYAMELEHEGKVYETSVSNIKNVEELLGKKIMVDGMIDGMIDHLIVHSICLKEDYERYAPKIEMEKLQLLCGAVGAERKKIEEMMETVDIQRKEGVSVDANGRLFNLSTDQEMQNFYPLVRQYMPMQVI